jgi:hypothetical protein
MHSQLVRHRKEAGPGLRRASFAALLAALLIAGPALAGPPPPPPPPGYQVPAPPPPVVYGPGYYYPPAPPNPPPPLPIAMRVIYAPFYAAGLVIRYGVYYVLVAPFEVLWRTVDYGVEGGVEHHQGS